MKLNQVIAIEKSTKNRINDAVTAVYKAVQHPAIFDGFSKQYTPYDEAGDKLPPENRRVQVTAIDAIKDVTRSLTELFDVTATKDYANMKATANVVVDGKVFLEGAPVPYLLFLEKQLTDLHTFAAAIPVLDVAEEWSLDANAQLYKTKPTETVRTKKVQRPLVMYPATPEHPAQTQLITEDVTVGTWQMQKASGALPTQKKAQLLERIETLQKAVKMAREEANVIEAQARYVGSTLLAHVTDGL